VSRDPRHDVLFEPIRIGPVTAKNRFYQVPHCNGMGHYRPDALAAMRGVKAEGGWAVVCTEEVSIHPSGDLAPMAEGRLWDDRDIPALARMTEAVHEHGALAGFQPTHCGHHAPNRSTRLPPMSPSGQATDSDYYPVQARAMDRSDIRAYRRWHRDAVLRASRAGFDLVYVYAGHGLSFAMQFLSRRVNQRSDEYGGSLENRVRLFRELIEETKDAVGDRCAVAVRFAVDELVGSQGITSEGEGREVVEMLAELPDLWDVNVSNWANDSVTSRFAKEGYQEKYVSFVKSLTTRPVVGVGRYTSPDAMAALIHDGVLDMIGAARPSIADPFLPRKIEQGRVDEICECIGCNICVAGDFVQVPIRCTQNPTMGEEWRRGWHPERIEPRASDDRVLVVGAGPAGLECARSLANRGYEVALAEATRELGGRVSRESALPGLAEWARVRDYRVTMLEKLGNVEIFRESRLGADDVREYGAAHVLLATGARWRRDGIGGGRRKPIPGAETASVHTPDDLMAGATLRGHVVIYDNDHYYLGGVLAEKLRQEGCEVSLVTPAAIASAWTQNTLEHARIQSKLLHLGVAIRPHRELVALDGGEIELACVFTQRRERVACDAVVLVTERVPDTSLHEALHGDATSSTGSAAAGIRSLRLVGDCLVPSTIAQAVWDGHRAARELEGPGGHDGPLKHEYVQLEPR
jgi:dimethylamine/trimethylamine dehydrogenase